MLINVKVNTGNAISSKTTDTGLKECPVKIFRFKSYYEGTIEQNNSSHIAGIYC